MRNLLSRLFAARSAARADLMPLAAAAPPAPPLAFVDAATLPIVDWDAMDAHQPQTDDPQALDAYWTVTAKAWLAALNAHWGGDFAVHESERFLLLGPLGERASRGVLDYAEKSSKRILRVLEGIANESEMGKLCVLVCQDDDQYYEYVSHYDQDGEYSLSSGSFIQSGYGHFVFVQDHLSHIEPVIAHELTHCMLQHLPIPLWLNEGLAVNTEHRLSPPPGGPLHTLQEMHQKHTVFWNAGTIQQFWSGTSWRRQDDGNALSYDLARLFTIMGARDYAAFRDFVNAASRHDAGDSAALEHLGYSVAHLAEAVLGSGPWAPKPDAWSDGIDSDRVLT